MSKKPVKRCIRPQCMEIYYESEIAKYCACGALLQLTEIEIPDKPYYKPKKDVSASTENNNGAKPKSGTGQATIEKPQEFKKTAKDRTEEIKTTDESFDFFGDGTRQPVITPSVQSEPLGYLYLIPEDDEEEEIEFKLGRKTIIGRSSDTVAVDVDLSQFGGVISRKHALITCEADGFYVTNLSENHSVHVNNKVVVKGSKMKLASEDGIILSKKVLLQFEEGE